METGCIVVLDVGKTNAKLSLWNGRGVRLAREVRANAVAQGPGYRALDVHGLDAWIAETLSEFAKVVQIAAIVPVGHGAAAALVSDGRLFTAPLDYEDDVPPDMRRAYDAQRDAFAHTGSPALPQGLNLGAQLHRLEAMTGPWPEDLQILLWPQYWAWRLCGVAASEASSLGCHTDLWRPHERRPSELAVARRWAARLPPLRGAGEALGVVTPEWRERAGLPAECQVICGLHDSNAALLAARGHPEIAAHDATVLSTGTWFVAMRSLAPGATRDQLPSLDERRDCLLNVDVAGQPAPSARFMGGREAELIAGLDIYHLTENYDPQRLIKRLPELIAERAFVLPSFVPDVGPFPGGQGAWINEPASPSDKRAVLGLYLALVADETLRLIGSRERLLVEGRFAEAQVFVRALATLRPDMRVYTSNAHDDVPYGALRLLRPELPPQAPLVSVEPLAVSLDAYRDAWRAQLLQPAS
ncbi:FGGY-family carbohydrate kinase [Phenylobacterium deserti]|uniref:Carbohydrate kinase n=1 Tax=Phenylobacterium deserti TaxID=1914756 RepID=A0A328ABV3_9CAUL|nr:carbohydrate kinase [Phenylobacterium deserti]RAK50824.1 carbohydrate kinase [Phenylobacterium deserti]